MTTRRANIEFWRSLGRAFGGALIFAFPLLMTMEMWWLGFYLDRIRIALFLLILLPVLVGLSYYAGFQKTYELYEDAIDALVAFVVGMVMSALFLTLFGELRLDMPVDVVLGKVILLAVPASVGAILASKQLGQQEENTHAVNTASYAGELFIMAAGALLLAFNVAPTEEMILIAYKMTSWHGLALALITMAIMHAIVYTVGFRGQERRPERTSWARLFYHFTLVCYAIALLVSLYVLWTFGRLEGVAFTSVIETMVVLAFPAGIGAAASRLVI